MPTFTYYDHILYNRNILRDVNETYIVEKQKQKFDGKKYADRIFKTILKDKVEASRFINEALGSHLMPDDIEEKKTELIGVHLEERRNDIIYEFKGYNIYFIIEQQTIKDSSMPWRMSEYSNLLISQVVDRSKIGNKNYLIPRVIPIVLYTGKGKWNVPQYIEEKQESFEMKKDLKYGEYAVVNVNDYTYEELLKKNDYISKIMLIEKYRRGDNIGKVLEDIIIEVNKNKEKYKGEGMLTLITAIDVILRKVIGDEKTNKAIERLKEEGSEVEMLHVLEELEGENEFYEERGRKKGRKEGRKEEKIQMIKNMIKEKLSFDIISTVSGFKVEQIEKIAKTI